MNLTDLSNLQLDILKEIGNIGSGNAATSMSKLINKKISMHVPSVKVVSINEIMDLIGGPEQLIVAILFQIEGEATGSVYFILSKDEAENLINQMVPNGEATLYHNGEINKLSVSVLQEVANILTGSYLTALSDFLKIDIHHSIPYFSVDMAGAVLTAGLVELSHLTDYAIIVDTKMKDDDKAQIEGNTGQFFLLPDPSLLSKIFYAMGIKVND